MTAATLVAATLALAGTLAPTPAHAESWLLRGAKVYVAPDQPPITDGALLIRGDRIVDVGGRESVRATAGTRVSDCSGTVVMAGFHNMHVHLLGPAWADASAQPPATLGERLRTLLTRHGYTTALDLGSDGGSTAALQRRIVQGEVSGPRILTLGWPLFPPQGLPGYLDHLAPQFLARLPQPATADQATRVVQANVDAGAVGTKLFIATPRRDRITRMPAEIARAAADATHRRGGLVVAHPTDLDGVRAAIDAGVDLLAHTTHGTTTPWPDALLREAVQRGLSMTPTLKLMAYELASERVVGPIVERLVAASVEQVRAFAAAGGDILFGTDAGYMADFDPTDEYILLARAGLTPMQILASLTTRPAAKLKDTDRGRLAPGMAADIVVLDADPADNPAHFAKVRCTIGAGRVLHDTRAPAASAPQPR